MHRSRLLLLSTPLLLSLAACEGDPPPAGDPDAGTCEPDRAMFASQALPRLERYCGSCHGASPQYGAPMSLLDVDALLAVRPDGTRLADRVVARLMDGSMPPVGMPRLPDADADALARWASCGSADVPQGTGLRASAPVFLSPDDPPPGLVTIDLAANEHPVGPEVRDEYRCFTFEPALEGDRFIRRFEMIYDETRVLHHLVLLRDSEHNAPLGEFDCYDGSGMPAGSEYLYAWAPGTGAFQFPEGGLRARPGDRFLVQIHYNNGAAIPDVRDSSGVRLYLDAPSGPEYGMIAIGPLDFEIPARESRTVSSRCTFASETRVLAGMPHMHQIGTTFDQVIARPDVRNPQPFVHLDGWEFETQLFYSLPVTLMPGDALLTSCTFDNTTSEDVGSGPDTRDEMCFDFMYVTPPPATRYCDEGDAEMPSDVRYVPSACLPEGTTTDVALVRGGWVEAATPPALVAGEVADARWELEGITYYVSTVTTPIGQIDVERTYVLGRGQVVTREGRLVMDVDSHAFVQSAEGPTFGGPNNIAFAGPFDASATPATIVLDCPGSGDVDIEWGIDGDLLTIGFVSESVPGAQLWPRYTFRRTGAL
ncbi:hypothetical protein [Sandaracinus amylolyticus]|uniref:monooxygenase n=1 Tax=Sandaracinus amylolyticus TaxID=927083 RepID=UPI001F48FA16|nr:hypothetical protein [Sandaracinus amylolyticus]UJR85482.1 Hypothetical protein I5071_75620 [Sandaracinus amylolyticus]